MYGVYLGNMYIHWFNTRRWWNSSSCYHGSFAMTSTVGRTTESLLNPISLTSIDHEASSFQHQEIHIPFVCKKSTCWWNIFLTEWSRLLCRSNTRVESRLLCMVKSRLLCRVESRLLHRFVGISIPPKVVETPSFVRLDRSWTRDWRCTTWEPVMKIISSSCIELWVYTKEL